MTNVHEQDRQRFCDLGRARSVGFRFDRPAPIGPQEATCLKRLALARADASGRSQSCLRREGRILCAKYRRQLARNPGMWDPAGSQQKSHNHAKGADTPSRGSLDAGLRCSCPRSQNHRSISRPDLGHLTVHRGNGRRRTGEDLSTSSSGVMKPQSCRSAQFRTMFSHSESDSTHT